MERRECGVGIGREEREGEEGDRDSEDGKKKDGKIEVEEN